MTNTLQSLQDQLALAQANSDKNDSDFTSSHNVATKRYNMRKNQFIQQISDLNQQIVVAQQ